MSTENERDTHFQHFAELLLDEMINNFNGSLVLLKDGHKGDRNENVTIIARRAYDLVEHALYRMPFREAHNVDDMTSFPD